MDEYWTRAEKLKFLEKTKNYEVIQWEQLIPDDHNNWLTQGMSADFDKFVSIGNKAAKAARNLTVETIFKTYSLGVSTNRDDWAYAFHRETLGEKVKAFIETYNEQVFKWTRRGNSNADVDNFVIYDDKRIKWSRNLKRDLQRGVFTEYNSTIIRKSLYRPFTQKYLYFADQIIDERGTVGKFWPTAFVEQENFAICVSNTGYRAPFTVLLTNIIPCLTLNTNDGFQCFPFYVYNEDGSGRRENITDWALEQFRGQYGPAVSKWDIFHYVYAVLHAPQYRQRYAENLKRDLPRIPFVAAAAWPGYVEAGQRLAALHRDYEQAKPYRLGRQENPQRSLDWRLADKMRLSPDRTALKYNEWLTLTGLPPRVFDYRLGNRSAVEWLIDQYQVSTDPRSGLTHDPNNPDDPEAIVRLVEQVVQVSLDTLAVLDGLPEL